MNVLIEGLLRLLRADPLVYSVKVINYDETPQDLRKETTA